MHFENIEAAIQFAIEREIEAADFYETSSREEAMSGSREMLLDFAREERKHQALLEKLRDQGLDQSASQYKFKWIPDIKRSDYVADMEYKKGMGYNELLMLAMKREEKALALYNQLLKQADSADSRQLFKMLCQEEAKHKLALETMYDDYMAELGD
jgi:rubrerythrin